MLRAVAQVTATPENIGAVPESEKGQPNGVATLDGSGKIPTDQLPVGDVTYLGNWDASTNTPTLANGAGVSGELYICDVAGTQDLGGGSVSYEVGDWLIYDGATWDRVPGHGPAPANPSATVGMTPKIGTARTFMRSDDAPAIDPAIAPTWTGVHTHTKAIPIITGADGNKLWLAKYSSGTGHTDAPKTLGATSTYFQVGGREYGSQGFAGIGFGYVSAPTDHPCVWVGHEEQDTPGYTTGDFIVATRPTTTNVAPTERFRITKTGDIIAASGYAPANALSLATKAYVDAHTGVVAADGKSAQTANVNAPTLYSVPVSGMYRVSAFVVVSQAATTSSTMPSVSVNYTEATTGAAVQDMITQTATTNQVGLHSGGSVVISAQQGSNIGYITSNYASSGATPMQYSVHIKVEFLG